MHAYIHTHSHHNKHTKMASTSLSILIILALISLSSPQTLAVTTPSAPSPDSSTGLLNLTAILEKNSQFTTFIRLLTTTQIANQIENQLNNSHTEGITVFAPTDNAFNNLKAGALNNLSAQEQIQVILYHVVPKYYTLSQLLTVSNPVNTQATGQNGGVFGLNFTGQASQVNVSTGVVETQVSNALRQESPLAVYQVDKVLWPVDFLGAKSPASAPAPTKVSGSNSKETAAEVPSSSEKEKSDESGSGGGNVGFGFVLGFGLICIGALL